MKRVRAKEVDNENQSFERPNEGDREDQALYVEETCVSRTIVGRIVLLENSRRALIDFPSNHSGELIVARSLVPLKLEEIGHEIALLFEEGDQTKPIILGVLPKDQSGIETSDILVDKKPEPETLVLTAGSEIVIRCGKASITLTKTGKLLIQGEYVVSRSAGVNKIRGGSVQIN